MLVVVVAPTKVELEGAEEEQQQLLQLLRSELQAEASPALGDLLQRVCHLMRRDWLLLAAASGSAVWQEVDLVYRRRGQQAGEQEAQPRPPPVVLLVEKRRVSVWPTSDADSIAALREALPVDKRASSSLLGNVIPLAEKMPGVKGTHMCVSALSSSGRNLLCASGNAHSSVYLVFE